MRFQIDGIADGKIKIEVRHTADSDDLRMTMTYRNETPGFNRKLTPGEARALARGILALLDGQQAKG